MSGSGSEQEVLDSCNYERRSGVQYSQKAAGNATLRRDEVGLPKDSIEMQRNSLANHIPSLKTAFTTRNRDTRVEAHGMP